MLFINYIPEVLKACSVHDERSVMEEIRPAASKTACLVVRLSEQNCMFGRKKYFKIIRKSKSKIFYILRLTRIQKLDTR